MSDSGGSDWSEDASQSLGDCLFAPGLCVGVVNQKGEGKDAESDDAAVLAHVKAVHGLDCKEIAAEWALDAYQLVRLVNRAREAGTEGKKGDSADWKALLGGVSGPADALFSDEKYLQPFSEGDPWLQFVVGLGFQDAWSTDDEEEGNDSEGEGAGERESKGKGAQSIPLPAAGGDGDAARVRALERALAAAQRESATLHEKCTEMASMMDEMREVASRTFFSDGAAPSASASAAGKNAENAENADDNAVRATSGAAAADGDVDDSGYFGSYDSLYIHQTMLQDRVRTEAYRDYIEKNADALFKGKTVLDIGCGTGILSMFAARAGAEHVYAVDMSDIIHKARAIVQDNAYAHKITLIQGMAEEVAAKLIKDGVRVDVIISEWMGYFLLFESMLDSVVVVRDMLAAASRAQKDGASENTNPENEQIRPPLVLPSRCSVELCAASLPTNRASHGDGFWGDVYGFRMDAMRADLASEADVQVFPAASLCSTAATVLRFDCNTVTLEGLEWESGFELSASRDAELDAIVAWFDIDFAREVRMSLGFFFSISSSSLTHFLLFFPPPKNPRPARESTSASRRARWRRRRTGSRRHSCSQRPSTSPRARPSAGSFATRATARTTAGSTSYCRSARLTEAARPSRSSRKRSSILVTGAEAEPRLVASYESFSQGGELLPRET
jgi:type I protein arginine methyltransferase